MNNFTYDNFNYRIESNGECAIGGDPTSFANAPINGNEFSGVAVVPSEVEYNETKYKVIAVGKYAFRGCSKMTGVVLPQTIRELGYDGFFGTAITKFIIPSSVTIIKNSAFSHMNYLRKIIIEAGSKLETLEYASLASAHKLESIIIPSLVKSISGELLRGNNKLKYIVVCGSEDFSAIVDPFKDINHPVKVYVTSKYPKGSTFGGSAVTVIDDVCLTSLGFEKRVTYSTKKLGMRGCLFVMILELC